MKEKRRTQLRLFLRLMLIATLGFIWINSMLSKEDSSSFSLGFMAWLRSIGVPIRDEHFTRKLAHFCEFGLLGTELTLLFWLRSGLSFQNLCNSAFAALLTAVTDETIQIFSNRGSQLKDVLLDFAGALTGIAFCALIVRQAEKKRKQ